MIAVFDSGYGGLTVLKELVRLLPEYDYLYFGDNARIPYGTRSTETIQKFTNEIVSYFTTQKVSLMICACNTMSSVALPSLKNPHLLGVIEPAVQKAIMLTKIGKIGVVGTRATIQSQAYDHLIKTLRPDAKVYSQACPLLVPLIEENYHRKPAAKKILREYLRPLKQARIDTLILGCTHYPMMEKDFKRMMGPRVRIVNSAEVTSEYVRDYLASHPDVEKSLLKAGKRLFQTTDDPERFRVFAENFLKMPIASVEKITL